MGYGNTNNTILLPDEEEQLVREELGRLANNQDERRGGHGTTSPGVEGYIKIIMELINIHFIIS